MGIVGIDWARTDERAVALMVDGATQVVRIDRDCHDVVGFYSLKEGDSGVCVTYTHLDRDPQEVDRPDMTRRYLALTANPVSEFAQQFNSVSRKHHNMMVDRGFHDAVDELIHLNAGAIVCERIEGQINWLEEHRAINPVLRGPEHEHNQIRIRQEPDAMSVVLKIALVVSECIELYEEIIKRVVDADACAEECADVVLRVMDLCEAQDWDLAGAIERKIEKNAQRAHKHGKRF